MSSLPQIQLPVFPGCSTSINSELAFEQRDSQVFYVNGHLPVFTHPCDDIASFRQFTSQLVAEAQTLLDQGLQIPEIGQRLRVLPNTIHKAISHEPK